MILIMILCLTPAKMPAQVETAAAVVALGGAAMAPEVVVAGAVVVAVSYGLRTIARTTTLHSAEALEQLGDNIHLRPWAHHLAQQVGLIPPEAVGKFDYPPVTPLHANDSLVAHVPMPSVQDRVTALTDQLMNLPDPADYPSAANAAQHASASQDLLQQLSDQIAWQLQQPTNQGILQKTVAHFHHHATQYEMALLAAVILFEVYQILRHYMIYAAEAQFQQPGEPSPNRSAGIGLPPIPWPLFFFYARKPKSKFKVVKAPIALEEAPVLLPIISALQRL